VVFDAANGSDFEAVFGGKKKDMLNRKFFAAVALLGASLAMVVSGCKSAPELTQADAQKMIQAKLDAKDAAPVSLTVDDQGMQMGANAKLWDRTKVYPNRFWADFTLTPEGKKQIKLAGGADVIQWRPESLDDKKFAMVLTTAVVTHSKAKDVQAPSKVSSTSVTVDYSEAIGLEALSDTLQKIAHTPGNKLSTKRTAALSYDGSAWKVDSLQ